MRRLVLLVLAIALAVVAVRVWHRARYPTHDLRLGDRSYPVMIERRYCEDRIC